MPEYDAFGREIGEDPLAALRDATNPAPPPPEAPGSEPAAGGATVEPLAPGGEIADADALAAWSGSAAARGDAAAAETPPAAQTVVPAAETGAGAAAERVSPAPPERASRPRRTIVRRRRGGLAGLLVAAAVIAAIGLVANSAVDAGRDIISGIQSPFADPAPTGLQAASLIRTENLRGALDTLAAAGLGRPTMIRIAPDRVDATLVKRNRAHNVQITAGGDFKDFGETPGSRTPFALEAIDPAAPERLVRRAANRKHPARTIDYVLITQGPPLTVAAYFDDRIVIGDRHGRPQRVIG